MGKHIKRIPKGAREYLKQLTSKAGKASAAKLTPKERKERARLAGIASGKARKKQQ